MNEPQLVLLTGHGTAVDTVAFSPDGLTFASGGRDGLVLLWDVATGALRRQLAGHQSAVTAMAFSPDSAMLATSGWYDEVRLWDVGTGKWLGTIPGLMGPLAFTASGSSLVARKDEALVLLDPESTEIYCSVGLDGEKLENPAVSLYGRYAAAEHDFEGRSELVVWDLRDETELLRYVVEKDFPGEVRSRRTGEMVPVRIQLNVDHLAVSSCGRWLAVDGANCVWLVNLHTGQRTHMLARGIRLSRSLAFSTDGELLAYGDTEGVIRIWDSTSGELRRTVRAHTSWASALAFSPGGDLIASGGHDRAVRLTACNTGEPKPGFPGPQWEVNDVSYSPDGRLLVSAHQDGTVRCWDVATGGLCRTFYSSFLWVTSVAVSPDGKWLAAGSSIGWRGPCDVEVWCLATGKRRQRFSVGEGRISLVLFLPGASTVVAGRWGSDWHGSKDRTFAWDLETWKLRYQVEGHTAAVNSDGSLLATATAVNRSEGVIQMRDAATGAILRTLHRDPEVAHAANHFGSHRFSHDWFASLRFSPDGRTLAAGYDGYRIGTWDVTIGTHITESRTDRDAIHGLSYSHDGSTLALGGSYREEVALWDMAACRERGRLVGHTSAVKGVAYSPDGTRLATASDDGTIKVWSPADCRLLATLRLLHPADPNAQSEWIAYTPTGHYWGSPGAHEFTTWKVRDELLPGTVYQQEFHSPDQVAQALR